LFSRGSENRADPRSAAKQRTTDYYKEGTTAVRAPARPSAEPPPARSPLTEALDPLSWLAPAASSLLALARLPAEEAWAQVRHDPAAVLLALRQSPDAPSPGPALLHAPALLEQALHHLQQAGPGFIDWNREALRPVYRGAVTMARLARRLAQQTGRVDPQRAWVCGLLAPLGWFAVCALDPAAAAACLAEPDGAREPIRTQRRLWGTDQAALARRLARRWRLPDWLTAVIGALRLPGSVAEGLGADRLLFSVTRLAAGLAQERGQELGLAPGVSVRDEATTLGLAPTDVEGAALFTREDDHVSLEWQDPHGQPLLPDLLAVAAENRRLRATPAQLRLEQEADDLHYALEEQVRGMAERLQAGKLEALAEFAAGAGHEINNPLAVISGQAQYLLGHEAEWFPGAPDGPVRKALSAVISQTRRVHGVLRDLMLFARPAPARPDGFDLPALLGEVAAALAELAEQRQIRLEVTGPERLRVRADAEQVRVTLTCLLRNAVEAAPTGGWARLALRELAGGPDVEVAVEDSGPGPDAALVPYLFDPFFSGRVAGRGRGLGLPIAWRLARQQGGDVRLEPPRPGEPTRFVLTLPLVSPVPGGPLDVTVNGCHLS
jgi:signal transduction histidine kinase